MDLDVGCGNMPRGDVNVDRFLTSGTHRPSKQKAYSKSLKNLPNLVCADVHNLPFQTDMFSSVTCYELLEHDGVKPNVALKELLRVSKTYVEFTVPSVWDRSQSPKRNRAHARVYRAKHLHHWLKNYVHTVKFDRMGQFLPCFYVPFGYLVRVWKN